MGFLVVEVDVHKVIDAVVHLVVHFVVFHFFGGGEFDYFFGEMDKDGDNEEEEDKAGEADFPVDDEEIDDDEDNEEEERDKVSKDEVDD